MPKPGVNEGVEGVPKAGVEAEGVAKRLEDGVPKAGEEDGVANAGADAAA